MKEKTWLEPRSIFDSCLIKETRHLVQYNEAQVISCLVDMFIESTETKDEAQEQAREWYSFNVIPLQYYFNICFDDPSAKEA